MIKLFLDLLKDGVDERNRKEGNKMVIPIIAKIIASNPPSIAIAIGGIGLLLSMPYAMLIFVSGVILQILWMGRFLL